MHSELDGDGAGHPPFFDERLIQLVSRLNVIGLVLMLAYLLLVLASAFPLRLLNPAWQVQFTGAIVDNAAIPLLGLTLLHLAAFFDPEDEWLQARLGWLARLAVLASLGFLLLIPLRAYNIWALTDVVGNVQERRLDEASSRLSRLREAVRSATSKEDLAVRLQAAKAPPLPAALAAQPLETIRADMNRSFDRLEAAVKQRRQQGARKQPAQSRSNLLIANGRQILTSLLYAVAFAAAGQRPSSAFSFLDDVLSSLKLPTLSLGPRASYGGNARMDDYIEQIGPEDDLSEPEDPAARPPSS